jgi:hypothetical protein
MNLETSNKEAFLQDILYNFSPEHGNELMAHGLFEDTSAH